MHVGPVSAPVIPDTQECFTQVAGHRMRYLRAGSGPPILLIHGMLAYSFSWRLVLSSLTKIRTVYMPDQLGYGFSDHPAELDAGIPGAAQRLWEFLDGLSIKTLDIVGSSLGGAVAVRMSASAPQRVSKLVLAAPVNPWSRHGRWITRILATKPATRMFVGSLPVIRATGNFWLRRLFADPARIAPGTLDGYAAPLRRDTAWKNGLAIVRHWQADMRQLDRDYAALADKRALLIWGDRDVAVRIASAKDILERMHNAELKIMKGVGHVPYDEAPEEFSRILLDFLSS
jgi:pimeloyl-ACP methyl ester carboxylesterase